MGSCSFREAFSGAVFRESQKRFVKWMPSHWAPYHSFGYQPDRSANWRYRHLWWRFFLARNAAMGFVDAARASLRPDGMSEEANARKQKEADARKQRFLAS
jgi:hypothetical protein